jgi:hypothetical protein
VELPDRHHLEWSARVYAVDGHCNTVRVAAGAVVAAYATRPAQHTSARHSSR